MQTMMTKLKNDHTNFYPEMQHNKLQQVETKKDQHNHKFHYEEEVQKEGIIGLQNV